MRTLIKPWEEWIQYEVCGLYAAARRNLVPKLKDIFILSFPVVGGRCSVLGNAELLPCTGSEPGAWTGPANQGLRGYPTKVPTEHVPDLLSLGSSRLEHFLTSSPPSLVEGYPWGH